MSEHSYYTLQSELSDLRKELAQLLATTAQLEAQMKLRKKKQLDVGELETKLKETQLRLSQTRLELADLERQVQIEYTKKQVQIARDKATRGYSGDFDPRPALRAIVIILVIWFLVGTAIAFKHVF